MAWLTTVRRLGTRQHIHVVAVLAMLAAALAGCGRGPRGPSFDPRQAGIDALAEYDQDGDGQLSKEEFSACPGLLSASDRVDANQDEMITEEEIRQRIQYYKSAPVRVVSGSMAVFYKGKPLGDATVTFEPESFLGPEFQPCSGVTNEFGETFVSREPAEFPGIYLGFYRVRISKLKDGKESIPAKYNVDSELGFEAAADLPNVSNVLKFDLK